MPIYRFTHPTTGKQIQIEGDTPPSQQVVEGMFAKLHPITAPPPVASPSANRLKDVGISLAKGGVGALEFPVGLADIVTGGRAGKALEKATGTSFKQMRQNIEDYYGGYTEAQQEAFRNVQEAKGILPTIRAALANPSTIVQSLAESAPSVLAGGAVGRGILKGATKLLPKANIDRIAAMAGGAGEGAVMAGAQAENIRESSDTGLLTPQQSALAALTGVAGMGTSALSGGIANKLGIENVESMLAKGGRATNLKGTTLPKAIAGGMVTEGAEEFTQSAAEQALANIALGKPMGEGVGEAAAMGAVTGAAMGGGVNVLHGKPSKEQLLFNDSIRGDKESRMKGYDNIATLLEQKGYKEEAHRFKEYLKEQEDFFDVDRIHNTSEFAGQRQQLTDFIAQHISLTATPKISNTSDEVSILESEGSMSNDSQNQARSAGIEQKRKTTKQEEPVIGAGQETLTASGDVQVNAGTKASLVQHVVRNAIPTEQNYISILESYNNDTPFLMKGDLDTADAVTKQTIAHHLKSGNIVEDEYGNLHAGPKTVEKALRLQDAANRVAARQQQAPQPKGKKGARVAPTATAPVTPSDVAPTPVTPAAGATVFTDKSAYNKTIFAALKNHPDLAVVYNAKGQTPENRARLAQEVAKREGLVLQAPVKETAPVKTKGKAKAAPVVAEPVKKKAKKDKRDNKAMAAWARVNQKALYKEWGSTETSPARKEVIKNKLHDLYSKGEVETEDKVVELSDIGTTATRVPVEKAKKAKPTKPAKAETVVAKSQAATKTAHTMSLEDYRAEQKEIQGKDYNDQVTRKAWKKAVIKAVEANEKNIHSSAKALIQVGKKGQAWIKDKDVGIKERVAGMAEEGERKALRSQAAKNIQADNEPTKFAEDFSAMVQEIITAEGFTDKQRAEAVRKTIKAAYAAIDKQADITFNAAKRDIEILFDGEVDKAIKDGEKLTDKLYHKAYFVALKNSLSSNNERSKLMQRLHTNYATVLKLDPQRKSAAGMIVPRQLEGEKALSYEILKDYYEEVKAKKVASIKKEVVKPTVEAKKPEAPKAVVPEVKPVVKTITGPSPEIVKLKTDIAALRKQIDAMEDAGKSTDKLEDKMAKLHEKLREAVEAHNTKFTKIEDTKTVTEKLFGKGSTSGVKDYENFLSDNNKMIGASQSISKAIKGTVEQLWKDFGLTGKVFVVSESDIKISALKDRDVAFSDIYDANGAYAGAIITDTQGNRIIALNDTVIQSSEHLINTLFHEVGHAIIEDHYNNAPDSVKDAIRADFTKWVYNLYNKKDEALGEFYIKEGKTFEDFERDMADFLTTKGEIDTKKTKLADKRLAGLFEEYKAQQIAKYIRERQSKPEGVVDRFFKSLAESLRKLFSVFQADAIKNKRAVPSIEKWLDNLLESQRITRRIQESGKDTYVEYSEYALPGIKEKPFNLLIDASKEYQNQLERTDLEYGAQDQEQESNIPNTHFGIGNMIHIRGDQRTTIDGKKVLHINEMQSDWEKQYVKSKSVDLSPAEITQLREDIKDLYNKRDKLNIDILKTRNDLRLISDRNQVVLRIQELEQKLGAAKSEIAPPPIEGKYWMQHAVRQIIRYAKEKGIDTITFPSTLQQVADVENWGPLEIKGDKYFAHGQDMTSIINRMVNKLPKYLNQLTQEMGGEVKQVEVDSTTGETIIYRGQKPANYKLNALVLSPELKKEAERFGPKFTKITEFGDITDKATLDSLEKVGALSAPSSPIDTFSNAAKSMFSNARQKFVDQFDPLKKISDKAYLLSRMSKNQEGHTEAALMYGNIKLVDGVYDAEANKHESFIKTLQMLEGEQNRFFWWQAAKRAEQLTKEEREHLFSEEDVINLKKLNEGKLESGASRASVYAKVELEYNRIREQILDISVDSGIISKESAAVWRNLAYVPFYRELADASSGPNLSRGGLTNIKAIKKLKGSTEKIHQDILSNVVMNWVHLLTAAAKNRAATETIETAMNMKTNTGEKLAYKVPKDYEGAIFYYKNGVPQHVIVNDKPVVDALSALSFTGLGGPAMKVMETFKHTLTAGITANPTFKVRNLIRDSLAAVATNPTSMNPWENLKQGTKIMKNKQSQEYASLLASGGIIRFGTMLEGRSSKNIQKLVNMGVPRNHIITRPEHLKDMFEVTLRKYNELGDMSEGINRAALYKKLIDEGKTHAEAAFAARDMLDFSMGGTLGAVRFLTSVIPFLNARIQGMDKLYRGWQADPKRFGAVLGGTVLASLLLLSLFHDDEDFKKREAWDRDNYWWFKVGGVAYRIPKPFEIGVMATLAERSVELWASDEMTKKQFMTSMRDNLMNTFAIDIVPQAFRPILDIQKNEDKFTGTPIESMGMERLTRSERFTNRTSELAKALGMLSDYTGYAPSPVQIDYLMKGYFGWLATAANTVVDITARQAIGGPERPAWVLKDMFLAGNFVESLPSAQSKYITNFYKQAKELEQVYATHQKYVKEGSKEKAEEYKAEHVEELKSYKAQATAKRQLTELNAKVRKIETDPTMSAVEKRIRINALREREHKIAAKFK